MIDIPEQYYKFVFTNGIAPQRECDYSSEGNLIYVGIAVPTAKYDEPAWIIQKTVYIQIMIDNQPTWVEKHSSLLEGKVWNDRASLVFP